MWIRWLPLIAGFVPIIASFGALAIGIGAGTLEACFPPLDGCLSISATGRKPPGSFLFKALMLPQAVLVFAVFVLSARWLGLLAPALNPQRQQIIWIAGTIAAIAMIVYVTYLGTREPIYEFMRRGGIYFYFVGVVVAEITLALGLQRVAQARDDAVLARQSAWLLRLCLAPLVLGILNLVLKSVLADADAPENAIEWIASLCLQAYMLLLFFVWRRTGLQFTLSVKG